MTENPIAKTEILSTEELAEIKRLLHRLASLPSNVLRDDDRKMLVQLMRQPAAAIRDEHGLSRLVLTLGCAVLFVEGLDADRNMLLAIMLYHPLEDGLIEIKQVRQLYGDDVVYLLNGLQKVMLFSSRNNAVNQENFRGLLLSLAEDIRVIIIMIVRSLNLMRHINHHPDDTWVRSVAFEASCLYAQLAHRLGLYKIKGEMEDLALKYTNRPIYTQIARELNNKKRERDAYIAAFIQPIKKRLEEKGYKFSIKGRTKSISSIWAKIQKQKVDMNHIYDLFAIRIILDIPRDEEKSACWDVYSEIANMYVANPARMKDWITIPKSNGYESLHGTVNGPQNKWVEVQIRSRRMDLVAEKGLAAHWRYKGVKSDNTDVWMNNIRDILETAHSGPMELMKNMRMGLYSKEVYAFTPKGDLFRLPEGSTVLDFAFQIHSAVGCKCTGAIVNGRHEKISYKLMSGDTVEILTSSSQSPKQDWLNIVVTSKARNKIKQTLNEQKQAMADLGKETYERRLRNRKLEVEDALLMKVIKKFNYKYLTDFFADVAEEKVDLNKVINRCIEDTREHETVRVTAEDFKLQQTPDDELPCTTDVIVIGDRNLKGLEYKMARCCSPIYGDEVFGFVSRDKVVKIHRTDCPNARNIRRRYPYRLIDVKWSGVTGSQMPVTLKILGKDDIGIVTNITSIINKEPNCQLRSIAIDSNDGLFQGHLVIGVGDNIVLNPLIRKIAGVKGVKSVIRI